VIPQFALIALLPWLASCRSSSGGAPPIVQSEAARVRPAVAAPSAPSVAPTESADAPSTGDTAEYSVLIASRRAGVLRQWQSGRDGSVTTRYEFNDRGRGPSVTQTVSVDRAGLPISMRVTGVNYLKVPVTETVSQAAGPLITWRNDNAAGRAAPGAGFYLPMETLPSDLAALTRALLLSPKKSLSILPEGIADLTAGVTRAVSAAGRTMRVTPYAITGLGLTPETVWLDAEQRLFATGGTWQMVIRRGFESVAGDLVAAQLTSSRARDSLRASRLSRRPRGAVAFVHAQLFDATARQMKPAQTVIVTGDRITAVGDDGAIAIPAGAEIIDASGKTLLPGLWDMHVHVQDDDGLLHLAAGVTTVRDLANDTDELLARRARFDAGSLLGPRVLAAGFIDGPGPFAGPSKVLVSTRDQARAAVENYAGLGYEQIKVYSSLDPALFGTVVKTAHQRGLRVSGHVPFGMTAEQMVKDGADELQHANFLFLNFLTDSLIDTRTPARFTAVARRAGSIDLRSERVQRFISLLKERKVVVDPTLNVFEQLFTARAGTLDQGSLPVATRLPPVARRSLLTGGLPSTPALEPVYRTSFIAMERLIRRLHDAGVQLVAGTDASAGFSLHRELELYAEAGISNTDILYIATLGAARVMKHDAEWGSLDVGKRADLLLVDGDPSMRMRDIRRADLVMKGGTIYVPDSLYAAVGVKPAPRKGVISAREVRAADVMCRGPAAAVPRGTTGAIPLNCFVTDSASAAARNRRPSAPAKKKATGATRTRPRTTSSPRGRD
jgi:cytosine/adenosine deaminase-related metal-dependent hydrolase